jgi:hypothetical protein
VHVSGADVNSALSDKAKREAAIRDQHVAALRREHEAMARHGKKDRAKLVAAELKKLGAPVEPEPEATAEPEATEVHAEAEDAPTQPTRKRTQTRA